MGPGGVLALAAGLCHSQRLGGIVTGLLGVAAAGVAAYLATTAIINRIKAAKDKKAAERAAVADAYRRSRLDAAAMLGRPLNAAEQKTLAAYFKQQAAQLGWRF